VVITGVYAAAEPPIPGVDERLIVDAVRRRGRAGLTVHRIPELNEVTNFVGGRLKQGAVELTLGAGSITKLADEILKLLSEVK